MFADLSNFALVEIDGAVGAGVAGGAGADVAAVYGGGVAHRSLVTRVASARVFQVTQQARL